MEDGRSRAEGAAERLPGGWTRELEEEPGGEQRQHGIDGQVVAHRVGELHAVVQEHAADPRNGQEMRLDGLRCRPHGEAANDLHQRDGPASPCGQAEGDAHAPDHHVDPREHVCGAIGPLVHGRLIGVAADDVADGAHAAAEPIRQREAEQAAAAEGVRLQHPEDDACHDHHEGQAEQGGLDHVRGPALRTLPAARGAGGSILIPGADARRQQRDHGHRHEVDATGERRAEARPERDVGGPSAAAGRVRALGHAHRAVEGQGCEEGGEGVDGVEVRLLQGQDREGVEHGGEQPRARTVQAAADDIHEPDHPEIEQARHEPAHQVHPVVAGHHDRDARAGLPDLGELVELLRKLRHDAHDEEGQRAVHEEVVADVVRIHR